jgi:hypothetical protein
MEGSKFLSREDHITNLLLFCNYTRCVNIEDRYPSNWQVLALSDIPDQISILNFSLHFYGFVFLEILRENILSKCRLEVHESGRKIYATWYIGILNMRLWEN